MLHYLGTSSLNREIIGKRKNIFFDKSQPKFNFLVQLELEIYLKIEMY